MEFLLANWQLIVFLILVVFSVGYNIYVFLKSPTEAQQKLILTWMISLVEEAEQIYPLPKYGEIKRSYVYRKFKEQYKWFGTFISEKTFNSLIDEALKVMDNTLDKLKEELKDGVQQ